MRVLPPISDIEDSIYHMYKSINLPRYRAIGRAIYKSINLSIYRPIDLSIYQPINRSMYGSTNQAINLEIYRVNTLSIYLRISYVMRVLYSDPTRRWVFGAGESGCAQSFRRYALGVGAP